MSGLPPLPGHPAAVRLLADRLSSTAPRLGALAAVLARLRDGATWDGPAGEAFGHRLREMAPVLDAVAARLGGAAAPLRVLADAMEEAQAVVTTAVLDADEAEHAYAVLEERAALLVGTGASEQSPEMLVVRHLQVEQVEAQQAARARHAAAAERFQEADRRCAEVLRRLAMDDVADSLPYRLLAGVSTAAHDVGTVGALAIVAPELRPVAALADAAAVGADAMLLAVYGEGDAGQLALGAGVAAAGVAGGALRAGATAGAQRTSTGVVSTARLTGSQRVALGALREARARRDAIRATFQVPGERGTASALIGGPTPRRAARWATGGAVATGSRAARLEGGASRVVARARALARERVNRAFLDDWRLATANGPQAQRMYASGATLEVAAKGASKAGGGQGEGGENAR